MAILVVIEVMPIETQRRLSCEGAVEIVRWGRCRWQVIEQAIVLVEGLEEHRAAPDVRVGRQRVEYARSEFSALDRG